MKTKLETLIFYILIYLIYETDQKLPRKFDSEFKKCVKCPPGWGVAQRCTKKTNTVCQRCTTGKTYSSQQSSKSPCFLCSKCGVGLYEAHKCTSIRDTICNDCLSYIDHKNFTKWSDFKEKCSYLFLYR